MADNNLVHPQPVGADDDIVETLSEAAGKLHVSITTLRRLIAAGEGPPVLRLSARRLGIARRSRRAWLAARTAALPPHGAEPLK
jgi:hypothetical protein